MPFYQKDYLYVVVCCHKLPLKLEKVNAIVNIPDDVLVAIKYLLFPTTTSIWDLKQVTDRIDTNVNEVIKLKADEFKNIRDARERLIKLTIARFKPIFRAKGEKVVVSSDLVDAWISETKLIARTLIELGYPQYAKAFLIEWISVYFLLVTLYVVWKGGGPKILQQFIEKGEFEEEAFERLLKIQNDEDFWDLCEKVGLRRLFELAIAIHAKSLEKTISYLSEKDRSSLSARISPILEKKDNLLNVFKRTLNELESHDYMNRKLFLLMLPTVLEALTRTLIVRQEDLGSNNDTEEILNLLKDNLDKIEIAGEEITDLGDIVLQEVTKISALINSEEVDSVVRSLRTIGERYLKTAMNAFGMTSMTILKVSPDIILAAVPLTPPPISVYDKLSPKTIVLITQDALEEIANWNFEAKIIFKAAIIRKPNVFKKVIEAIENDPLAFTGLRLIMGDPIPFILEALLPIAEIENLSKINEDKIHEIVELLNYVMRKFMEACEYLKRKGLEDNDWLRTIFLYYIHRLLFFIAPRLTSNLRKILSNYGGQDFLLLYEKLSKKVEALYPKVKEKEGEDISELFA